MPSAATALSLHHASFRKKEQTVNVPISEMKRRFHQLHFNSTDFVFVHVPQRVHAEYVAAANWQAVAAYLTLHLVNVLSSK